MDKMKGLIARISTFGPPSQKHNLSTVELELDLTPAE
jgi:hypothetical protein